ncbi:MAG: hypothetical protein WAX14_21305 [Rhodococcus sp. (in: high G+C Gram-positive bacteria)]|uniref:hypothetical protein n=1 Tax=Rhodococcus sp. TaxID=1831 RepID=UPI003BB7F332
MEMDEQLRELAWQLSRSGHDWNAVADELGCDVSLAQAMAERYRDDTDARAQAAQFRLFDV